MIKIMWKQLFVWLLILSYGSCFLAKQISSSIMESEIRINREVLETQHHVDYLGIEVIYRKWPEVQENPKHDCQRFLGKIFSTKKDFTSIIPGIQKLIINYRQIRDGNNSMLMPKRIMGLQCQLPSVTIQLRKYFHFIRSPQSPDCALLLNRMGKKGVNFYIVENVCNNQEYVFSWKMVKLLKCDKSVRSTTKGRKPILVLSSEEIKIKRVEFEEKHYEYCFINSGISVDPTHKRKVGDDELKAHFRHETAALERRHYFGYITEKDIYALWPEVRTNYMYYCKWLLPKLFLKKDVSHVTANFWEVTLIYKETESMDEVQVTALKCKFPIPVKNRKFVHFIRSTDPTCALFVNRVTRNSTKFFITAEICEFRPNNTFWKIQVLKRKNKPGTKSAHTKKHYEKAHDRDFLLKQADYETWPELQVKDINKYCHTFLMKTFPRSCIDISNVRSDRRSIFLYYREIQRNTDEGVPLRKVHALSCYLTNKSRRNKFLFVRTPEPSCVFLVNQKLFTVLEYHISKQFCEDGAASSHTANSNIQSRSNHEVHVNQAEEDLRSALSPIEVLWGAG